MPKEDFELRILDDFEKVREPDEIANDLARIMRAIQLRGGEISAPSLYLGVEFPDEASPIPRYPSPEVGGHH